MKNIRSISTILSKLKTDLKQGKTLLLFTSLQTVGQVIRMLTPLLVAKLFTKEMWGRYNLCEPIVYFFSALLILSARTPFIIFANQERSERGNISRTFTIQCIFLVTSICLFVTVISVFGIRISTFFEINQSDLVYIALAFFGFIMKDFAGNLFMALNRRAENAFLEFTFGILTLLFFTLFYFLNWKNLQSIFLSYFLASLIVLVISLLTIDFKMLSPLIFDHSQFKQMLNFTLWMIGGTVSSNIISLIGPIALKYFGASLENIGQYGIALKFFKGFMVLIYIIPSYFLPHISANIRNPEKIRAYLYHKRPRVLLLGVIGFTFAWLVIPYFLSMLYKDKFPDAVFLIRILLIACVVYLYTAMYNPLFGALKIYKFPQIIAVTHLIIYMILNILLIPPFKFTGAAIAIVLSYFYLAIAYEFYYRKKMKVLVFKKNS